MSKVTQSFSAQLLGLVEAYLDAGGKEPYSPRDVAEWAIKNGRWDRHKATAVTQCAREISRALREDYYTDAKGRNVRARHPVRYFVDTPSGEKEQRTLWQHHQKMSPEFAERSFKQRRLQIVGDCTQLKIDVDSWNDQHDPKDRIQLKLDFTCDVAEGELGDDWERPRKSR
jgi:hypothetical protein